MDRKRLTCMKKRLWVYDQLPIILIFTFVLLLGRYPDSRVVKSCRDRHVFSRSCAEEYKCFNEEEVCGLCKDDYFCRSLDHVEPMCSLLSHPPGTPSNCACVLLSELFPTSSVLRCTKHISRNHYVTIFSHLCACICFILQRIQENCKKNQSFTIGSSSV